jgi:hypothetical protein
MPRSDEMLGEWARRFRRAWRNPPAIGRDVLVRSPDSVKVLRGDNPELRPAIRLAVRDVVDTYGIRAVTSIAQRLLPIPVRDFQPDVLENRCLPVRKTIVQLVEYVDRSGVMAEFLQALARAYPSESRLQLVRRVFNAWDNLHYRLLYQIADDHRRR